MSDGLALRPNDQRLRESDWEREGHLTSHGLLEQLVETMFALAVAGKTNKKGMPNPLRLAVIARAHFDVVRLPFPPAFVQRFGLTLGAPLGRILG